MIEAIILVILGLVLLTFAADKFVDGAVGLSINLKIPTLIIIDLKKLLLLSKQSLIRIEEAKIINKKTAINPP